MSEDSTTDVFKPRDMYTLDPDSWDEYLRQIIHHSLPKSRTPIPSISQSYQTSFAIHLLDLNMLYISEIQFYKGIEDGKFKHEYFIAHVKSLLGREGETVYLGFGRHSVEADEFPWILGPYVRRRAAGDKAETTCKRYGYGELGELRGKLVGRICFPTPSPTRSASTRRVVVFAGSSLSHSSPSSTSTSSTLTSSSSSRMSNTSRSATIKKSLRLDELLITISSIHERYPNYQDNTDCYWFTAFSFRILCARKSISYYEKKRKELLLVNPNGSGVLGLYTKHMKRRDGFKEENGDNTDVLEVVDLLEERIKEFEVMVDQRHHQHRFKRRTSQWR